MTVSNRKVYKLRERGGIITLQPSAIKSCNRRLNSSWNCDFRWPQELGTQIREQHHFLRLQENLPEPLIFFKQVVCFKKWLHRELEQAFQWVKIMGDAPVPHSSTYPEPVPRAVQIDPRQPLNASGWKALQKIPGMYTLITGPGTEETTP